MNQTARITFPLASALFVLLQQSFDDDRKRASRTPGRPSGGYRCPPDRDSPQSGHRRIRRRALHGEIRLPETPVIGIGLDLQCWTGSGWTNLYRLTRDSLGVPTAIPHVTDVTFAEPDLGLSLPNQSRILVPDVVPGIYRISDTVVDSGREFPGFAYLEVVAP